ncbi:hypothetical protein METP3_02187 [Methanosarcinales archaeon]|nr:hypothetical protein METP3_02187 [Methanosarcinales archaeon]
MTQYNGVVLDTLNTSTMTWVDDLEKKESTLIAQIYDLFYKFIGTTYSPEIMVSGGSSFLDDLTFTLQNGIIEDVSNYVNDFLVSGSIYAGSKADIQINTGLKEIYVRLKKGQSITNTDLLSFKWLWDTGLGRFRDRGFYQLDYEWTQYYKPSTINIYRTTYVGGVSGSATNSTYTQLTTSAFKMCGQDTGYEVAKAMDNLSTTEWRHGLADTVHVIGFQLSALKVVGAVDVLYTGLTGHEWTMEVLISDGVLDGFGSYYTRISDSSGGTSTLLKDSDVDFIANGVQVGDYIVESSTQSMCKVLTVLSSTQLVTDPINSGTWNSKTYQIMSFDTVKSGVVVSGGEQWVHNPFNVRNSIGWIIIKISSTDYGVPTPDLKLYDFGEIQVQILNHDTLYLKGLNFEFTWDNRTAGTATGYEVLAIRNVQIKRYKELGSAESSVAQYIPTIDSYDSVWINATIPFYRSDTVDFSNGIDVGVQLAVSDDGINWSSWFGGDGTSATYFKKQDWYIDTLPGGYTGFYYKWKFFLWSDGRDTPILNAFWIFLNLFTYQEEVSLTGDPDLTHGNYLNPVITVPMTIQKMISDDFDNDFPAGYVLDMVDLLISEPKDPVHMDILSGIERWLIYYTVFSSWLESVVGQVIQGYARDQNEAIILNGFKVVITSTYTFGFDSMGSVNPDTGWYELFVKSTIYDNRWLMATLNTGKTFDVAYRKYGLPSLIDGTMPLVSPQDLHFWVPSQICGKSVAYVGSLVTY